MTSKTRLILCTAVLAYLAGDFFLFNGPFNRAVRIFNADSPASIEKARIKGLIALVHEQPISNSQLDRAIAEELWLRGSDTAFSPLDENALRKTTLQKLIDHELLRAEIAATKDKIEAPAAEIDERLQRLKQRFLSEDDFKSAINSQGISSEKDIRDRIAAGIREEKFLNSAIAADIKVSDDEAKKWFADHQQSLGVPERVEVRHIFVATLETPADQAKQKLDAALAALIAKQKDFATLAKELSEDPASKDKGGQLGWMTRQRLAPDFAEPVFSLAVSEPSLIRTKLGWHLIEVTGRKPAEARSFEDAKPEVIAALEAVKRRDAVTAYREKLRAASKDAVRILDPTLLP